MQLRGIRAAFRPSVEIKSIRPVGLMTFEWGSIPTWLKVSSNGPIFPYTLIECDKFFGVHTPTLGAPGIRAMESRNSSGCPSIRGILPAGSAAHVAWRRAAVAAAEEEVVVEVEAETAAASVAAAIAARAAATALALE